jgi:cytochrome d ubiquinol oxidase subunit I
LESTFIGVWLFGWKKLIESPLYLKIMMLAIPLLYLAIQFGWLVTELGRQPWIVYGLVRTADAASPIAASQVAVSLVAIILVYGVLGAAGFYQMFQKAIKGPENMAVSLLNSPPE